MCLASEQRGDGTVCEQLPKVCVFEFTETGNGTFELVRFWKWVADVKVDLCFYNQSFFMHWINATDIFAFELRELTYFLSIQLSKKKCCHWMINTVLKFRKKKHAMFQKFGEKKKFWNSLFKKYNVLKLIVKNTMF